ncbi:unnamed protein product [Cuscuta campestris]|uniref:F-box domain-containing protein n=1 Tax=Cuscuta campestris TaxID=132261 RepID=A0A484MTV0_9ASTE|nr:unnamed protein product [Cuscuta campestris]
MHGHVPHPATPISDVFLPKRGKKRGSYNCGRCGLPKKGHVCNLPNDLTPTSAAAADADISESTSSISPVPLSTARPQLQLPPSAKPVSRLRRALSFDDVDLNESPGSDDEQEELDLLDLGRSGRLPFVCAWEVLRRLPPAELLSAASVCKGWRETARRLWRAAEELRLRVPAKAQIGHVRSLLQKCPALLRLSLRMESDVDATLLACIAFSCPNLESLEIITSKGSVNQITGEELGHFVSHRKCLTNLKMEGCCNFGGFTLCSTKLSTLWLSELRCLSKMVFNCPNLKEISLDFSREGKDTTDLSTMVEGLGRCCPRLENIHIASTRISHAVVLSLTEASLSCLRMLSLVLGSEITDASVAAIASSYSNLELLDLSGSSITDNGIGMICNVFPENLSKLLLALCPNITSSGIQFAAAQLPHLEIMDCGMTLSDPNVDSQTTQTKDDHDVQKVSYSRQHSAYQKLIIKHSRLKKLSLWGCSGLDSLYLNCPELDDLNLNYCINLQPERLLLQCANLENVHALGCQDSLVETIQNQVISSDFMEIQNTYPCKRLPDGSKRVQVPHMFRPQPSKNEKKKRKITRCSVHVHT